MAVDDVLRRDLKGDYGRYIIIRGRWDRINDEWSVGEYVELATDSLIRALLDAEILRQNDDGTSWNARRFGDWQVFDTSMTNWCFDENSSLKAQ